MRAALGGAGEGCAEEAGGLLRPWDRSGGLTDSPCWSSLTLAQGLELGIQRGTRPFCQAPPGRLMLLSSHFRGEEPEPQRGALTRPRPHSLSAVATTHS